MNEQIKIAGMISVNLLLKIPQYFGLDGKKKFLAKVLLFFYEVVSQSALANLWGNNLTDRFDLLSGSACE